MTIATTIPAAFAPAARGPVSDLLLAALVQGDPAQPVRPSLFSAVVDAVEDSDDVAGDDDLQLALFLLYACSYGSLDWIDAQWEWHPGLLEVRMVLERGFEQALRRDVAVPDLPEADAEAIAAALFRLTAPTPGPSLARFVAKRATLDQAREFLVRPPQPRD
jgi:hypothetical protein